MTSQKNFRCLLNEYKLKHKLKIVADGHVDVYGYFEATLHVIDPSNDKKVAHRVVCRDKTKRAAQERAAQFMMQYFDGDAEWKAKLEEEEEADGTEYVTDSDDGDVEDDAPILAPPPLPNNPPVELRPGEIFLLCRERHKLPDGRTLVFSGIYENLELWVCERVQNNNNE